MYESTQDTVWAHSIDLAQQADFDLGSLRVHPATCEVEWNGTSQPLQRRVMQVLVALAHARGSVVSQDDLIVRCWRGLSVTDDAIYRCISQLRKLAGSFPEAPFAIEAIPGVGYRLSSGEDGNGAAPNSLASPGHTRLRAWVAAAALLILLGAGSAVWILPGRAPVNPSLRIAVQPFEALTDSEDARLLARRIPNEIVDALGGSQVDAVLAGQQAGIGAPSTASSAPGLIVTGILHDDGSSTIVDVRVEDGATRAAIWSTQFERGRREASDLTMEVAARVADVVNYAIFARSANPPLTDNAALSALLQTNDLIRESQSDWAQLIDRAQAVVARHPEFAFGHDVLAVAYAHASGSIDIPERAEAMKEAARREAKLTMKLDPADAGAYVILAGLEPTYRGREAWLVRGMKYARHPKPPVGALYSYQASLLGDVGRFREALSSQLVAHATDEWGAPKTAQLARAYANVGNLPAARAWIRRGVQLWPNHSGIRRFRRYIAGFYEQPSEALATFDAMDAQSSSGESENEVWRSFVKAKAARSERLTAQTALLIRKAADQEKITRENEIMMLAALGETRKAMEAANSALDRHGFDSWVLFAPITRSLRQDPDFVSLVARMGLIAYWRETGKRPDFCTDPALRNECTPQLLAAMKRN